MSPTPQEQGRHFKEIAVAAARAADDKKGDGISLLHIKPVSSLADYMLIVSVTSPPHMKAVEEHIKKTLKEDGIHALHRDGRRSEHWRVMDFGGLLVHIMHPAAREFYALEKVFDDAKSVAWAPKAPAKKAVRKKTAKKKAAEKKTAKKTAKKKAKTKGGR